MLTFGQYFSPENAYVIHRGSMPQIKDIKKFEAYLDSKDIWFRPTSVDPNDLSKAQADIDDSKVEKLMASMLENPKGKPIVYASDGVLIDGHHRSEAARRLGIPVKALYVDLPSNKLLRILQDDFKG